MIEVAIVGGGPAGSYCAYCLAENDVHAVIFDHTHPREKPCGGLVTPLAQKLLPFLKKIPIEHCERNKIYFISPYGKRICLSYGKSKLLCFSRLKLDQYLINMAVNKNAQLINEKVEAVERKGGLWKVKTTRKSYTAKTMIGADGVSSLVRRSTIGPLSRRNKGFCYGYFVRGLEKEDMTIKFLFHKMGYIWVFPRAEHTSVGIGCPDISRSHGLKMELDTFIEQHYPYAEEISRWAALIPSVKTNKTFRIPLAGPNWILIGDAAGHVNPIVGEGILYALLDGELAAQAVVDDSPQLFNKLWKETFGWKLFTDVKLMKWIYKKPVLELYCEYLKFSSFIRPAFSVLA
ncbi:MAG: NAD(P)/FAD-dependent oxidoreductase [Candidatus Bathyarchaeota archaeon]|nr:MAG: NAD(P)/FAD-dependent oxidoreductase [Candidatus Bathyarchaeota archaeon]